MTIFLVTVVEWRPWQDWRAGTESRPHTIVDEVMPSMAKEPVPDVVQFQPIRAQLNPLRYTTVAAELSAKVQEVPFREGDAFKKGQRLVLFDCAAQHAQHAKAKAAMAIAERNQSTNHKLLTLGAVGRIEYENSLSEYQKAKADVDELVAVLTKCAISAPFDGRVAEQKVRAQQFVQASQPLLDILDQSALELEFIAPSKWTPWLRKGHRFQITVDETSRSYPAKVTRVGARIDAISQTFKVAAVIDGDYPELVSGMSGTLEIQPPQAQ